MSALLTNSTTAFDAMRSLCHLVDCEQVEPPQPDEDIEVSDESAYQMHLEAALCDMDSFTEWTMTECADETPFKYQFHGNAGYEIARDYSKAAKRTTAELQALMYMSPNANVMRACRDEIVKRYAEHYFD